MLGNKRIYNKNKLIYIIVIMNENWINQPSIYTDIPVVPYRPPSPVQGQIDMDYVKGKEYTELTELEKSETDVSKLDYINPEYIDPQTMYMNWHKKHPQGQWAPMKSENKMVSYERKNNIIHKV